MNEARYQWDTEKGRKVYPGATPSQVLDFINQYVTRRGFSPSWEEIKDGCGFGSKSTVHAVLGQMKARGLVDWVPGTARTIRVLPQED